MITKFLTYELQMELGSVSHALSILQLILQHVHSRSAILLPILSYFSGWTIEQIGIARKTNCWQVLQFSSVSWYDCFFYPNAKVE